MVYFDIGILTESDSAEACGETEHTVDYIVELEIRAERFFIVFIFCLFEFIGPVAVVPGIEFYRSTGGLGCEFGDFGKFTLLVPDGKPRRAG